MPFETCGNGTGRLERDRLTPGHPPTAQKPFWKPRGYDFNVVNEHTVIEKLDYIHKNPIRRGLVRRPDQWSWSSYRYYELDDASPIAMDWDGGFPIA